MTDVTLQTISPGYQSTNALNNNFSAIQSALADSLSKSQTASNQMSTSLDMNGYQILNAVLTDSIFENIEGVYQDFSLNNNRITNLAPATALTDAVNLSQLSSAISGFSFPVTSVFGRTGTITAQAGDYSASDVGAYTTSEVDTKVSTETVHSAASGAFDRANGGIQTYTLTAAETISVTINEGQSMTLHLSAGATYTVTWPTMTWVGGSAPTLTAADVIEFWKVGTTLYGAYVGSIA